MKNKLYLKIPVSRYFLLIPVLLSAVLISFLFTGSELKAEREKFTVRSHDITDFPLTGKHRTTPCAECHTGGVIKNTPTQCEACHWERRQDDRYQLQLGYHCGECHSPFGWKKIIPGSWDHLEKTGFKREGIHKTLDCFNCHKESFRSGLQQECISCHREDYNNTKDPDHRTAGFPEDCKQCHRSQITWKGVRFEHSAFLLSGIHKTLNCSECHRNGVFTGTSPDCFSCHEDDYNSSGEPDHKKAGFPTHCTLCHQNVSSWEGALFNHTSFILEGAHKVLDCSACHGDGIYTGKSSACVSCHLKDYNNSRDPNHRSAGFPTSCENCHSASHSSWRQAEFLHQFPIRSGKHSGFDCTDCHLTANYREFSCIDCHAHSKPEMDNEHKDESGYVYNSQNCYACHPRGDAD